MEKIINRSEWVMTVLVKGGRVDIIDFQGDMHNRLLH